jgi:UDP-N-acetylglucosamine 1-carboxyvinyltransferase
VESLKIYDKTPLIGEIKISGAKNSALPLMACSLLTNEKLILKNVPYLSDIRTMEKLLKFIGAKLDWINDNEISIKISSIQTEVAPYELVSKMRASIVVLGPLLAKYLKAKVSFPGGCVIGVRPVDAHLDGLKKLGAIIEIHDGYICASAPKGLVGSTITMPIVSVTATENLIMAATLAKGETTIINAAREPEVVDLCECLNKMGAKIEGFGTDTVKIKGVKNLNGTTHSVIPDRLETGTYAIAPLIAGGEIKLTNTDPLLLQAFLKLLQQMGANIEIGKDFIIVSNKDNKKLDAVDINTEVYPGIPTDLQAQLMALTTICNGTSVIKENIFENRFMQVQELCRMGANISVQNHIAVVRGVEKLEKGVKVMSSDIRASAALVLAGLSAGDTTISRIYHLDRGYENLVEKLKNCGANIERI